MLLIFSLVVASAVVQADHHVELCSNVTIECAANVTCNQTNIQVVRDCASALQGGDCSEICLTTYRDMLLKDPIGQRFNNCDCGQNNPTCRSFERQCLGNMPASDQCTDLQVECHMDIMYCRPLQAAYESNCTAALTTVPPNCTQACRDSYNRLIAYPLGYARAMCKCNASDLSCLQREHGIRSLCFNSTVTLPPRHTGAIDHSTPPTASPTVPPDNCNKVVDQCRGSSACQTVLSFYSANCTSNCSEDCKTSLQALLLNDVGVQLALCTCTPRYPTCNTAIPSGLRDRGVSCNITVPTRPPPITTSQPSRAFGFSAMEALLVGAIALIAQLL